MPGEKPKSASLISVSESLRSIGFGDPPPILRQNNCVKNSFRVLSEQSKPIRDTITVVLYCSLHDRILLSKFKNGDIFFPYYYISSGESPSEIVTVIVDKILKCFPKYFAPPKEIKLARLVRLPISDANRNYITQYTYFACVTHQPKFDDVPDRTVIKRGPLLYPPNGTYWNAEFECTYAWTLFSDFPTIKNTFWGPEVQEQSHQIRNYNMKLKDLNLEVVEFCLASIEQFFSENSGPHFGIKDSRALIRHSRIDPKMLIALWNEWIFHCTPSMSMCYLSFKKFLYKIDIVPKNVSRKDLEEFDRISRRLYHAFISTGDYLRSVCHTLAPKSNSTDFECTDLRKIQSRSSFPQLDFLTFVLGLAILDSNITSYLFWEIHMMFAFSYNSYKDDNTNAGASDEDCITLAQLKDMIYEVPEILTSGIISKLPHADISKSDFNVRQKPSVDEVSVIIMKTIGKFEAINERSVLKFNDFRILHDSVESDEIIDLMCFLSRAHYRLEQDGHILRRIETQMMIRQTDSSPGKWLESHDCEQSKLDDSSAFKVALFDDRIRLARKIVSQNIERERCEECLKSNFKISSKLTNMNRSGYPTDFINLDEAGLDCQKSLNNSEIPILFLAQSKPSISMIEIFNSVMSRKQDIKLVFKAIKNILIQQTEQIRQVDCPAVVIGEIRGNHLLLANICQSVCPLVNHMPSVSIITCGNYLDDDFGIEALVYLFSAKIHSPDRIILLKGPNDNKEFICESNLFKKNSEIFDNETWNLLFDCLDLLPLAAIVKDKIFVSKSGIPLTTRKLAYIQEFKEKSTQKLRDSIFATQIISGQLLKSKTKLSRTKTSKLQASNTKSRLSNETKSNISTSSTSSTSSSNKNQNTEILFEDVDKFLRKNDFSHFVRSECWNSDDSGTKCYKVQMDCQIITLGSLQPYKILHSDSYRINGAFLLISKSALQLIKDQQKLLQAFVTREL